MGRGQAEEMERTSEELLYDVVVIGAGIVGSMIARELSRYEVTKKGGRSSLIGGPLSRRRLQQFL